MLTAQPRHNDKILKPAIAFGLSNAPPSDRVQSYEGLFIRTDAALKISQVPLLLSFKGNDRRLRCRQPNCIRSPRAWRGCWDPGGAFEHNVVLFGRGHRLVTGHVNNAATVMTAECWSKRVADDRSPAPWIRSLEKPSEEAASVGIEELLRITECIDGKKYVNIHSHRNGDNNEKKQIIDKYAWNRYGFFHPPPPLFLSSQFPPQERQHRFTLHSQFNDNYSWKPWQRISFSFYFLLSSVSSLLGNPRLLRGPSCEALTFLHSFFPRLFVLSPLAWESPVARSPDMALSAGTINLRWSKPRWMIEIGTSAAFVLHLSPKRPVTAIADDFPRRPPTLP